MSAAEEAVTSSGATAISTAITASSSSVVVTQIQLESLDDTDCYASVWGQILQRQRHELATSSLAAVASSSSLWGGKGMGGRGLARRTVQPKDVIIDDVRLQYLPSSSSLSSSSSSGSTKGNSTKKNTKGGGGIILLENATIKFLHNHVYTVIGRNGCGKTTLLKKMQAQTLPGWSIGWSSMYVPPTLPIEYLSWTPFDVATHYIKDCQSSSNAATQYEIQQLEDRIETLDLQDEEQQHTMELLCEELSKLEDQLTIHDDARTLLIQQHRELFEKDFNIDAFDVVPCKELSLLQRKNVLLCTAMICCRYTTLLLLDEPTTDLDVRGLIRLRSLIDNEYSKHSTVVMVSHDIDLINDVSTDIVDLCLKKLWYYPNSNYDSYRIMKEQKERQYMKQSQLLEKKNEQLQTTLRSIKDRPVPKRKGGGKKKAKAVASQRKKIEWNTKSRQVFESTSSENTNGLPWNNNSNTTVTQRLRLREILKTGVPDKAVQFVFPPVTSFWGEPLITAFDVGYKDEELRRDDTEQTIDRSSLSMTNVSIVKRPGYIFDCVDLCVEEGSVYCLLGPALHTVSLLKLLAKKHNVKPTEGTVHHASGITIGYYCQNNAEEPDGSGMTTPSPIENTALDILLELFPAQNEQTIRGHLTSFGLSPTSQAKTPIACLSGGEYFRFQLAKLFFTKPNVICIEHPTSHLDVESVEAFSYGLRHWNGTVIMICQDANFLRSLQTVNMYVIIPEEGKVRRIVDDGTMQGMDSYLQSLATKT